MTLSKTRKFLQHGVLSLLIMLVCAAIAGCPVEITVEPPVEEEEPGSETSANTSFEAALGAFVAWLEEMELAVTDDLDENGIPDLDHAALLDYILATPSVSCHEAVTSAYLTNLSIAEGDATKIESSDLDALISLAGPHDYAKLLAGALSLGESNTRHLLEAVLQDLYPGFHPEANLLPDDISMAAYPTSDSQYMSAWGDADGDGVTNLAEYRAAANQDAFLQAATDPSITRGNADPLIRITSVPGYAQAGDATMTGVVENLPGDGTGHLLVFLSRSPDAYYSRSVGDGFLQPVSNGVPWSFTFSDTKDPYAVRIVCHVVPVSAEPTHCGGGYCEDVPVPESSLASAVTIRAPLPNPANQALGIDTEYQRLQTEIDGRGAIYTSPANARHFLADTPISVRARASLGWRFDRWEGDVPPGMEAEEQVELTMTEPLRVKAYFTSEYPHMATTPAVAGNAFIAPQLETASTTPQDPQAATAEATVDPETDADTLSPSPGAPGGAGSIDTTGEDHAAPTFEPVLPNTPAQDGTSIHARVDATLALRLRANTPIAPESIVVSVPDYPATAYNIDIVAAEGPESPSDYWVRVQPADFWYHEDTFEVSVSSDAASAAYTFTTESEAAYLARTAADLPPLWQPEPGVDYVAEALSDSEAPLRLDMLEEEAPTQTLPGGVGVPYVIGPETAFDAPRRVWLPIPNGVDPFEVTLYYYKRHGEGAGWYPADQVKGFLAEDSCLDLALADGHYFGFLGGHGGVVQLGALPEDGASVPLVGGTIRPPGASGTRPYGYLLMVAWLVAAVMSAGVYLQANELRRFAKRHWMQLGLTLQNEDGPFFGKACWSGYYKDNQGVWRLDRRKNPDRRRLRTALPHEMEMRKTVRRAIDRQIIEWGQAPGM